MNYRHIYHAGNFADVFKHLILMLVLDYLKQKDKPFFVLDTHAGIGLYDLDAEQAQKTKEAEAGIRRLAGAEGLLPPIQSYLKLIRRFNRGGQIRHYPGSPLIAREMLRSQDRLVVNELHPEDVRSLRKNMGKDRRIRIENRDGYACLKALVPPPERRGAVLIDPPFEARDEFTQMTQALTQAYRRWATGTYMFWYPIKDPAVINKWHTEISQCAIPRCTALDFYLQDVKDPAVLNGCGLLMVNPPWTLVDDVEAIMPQLTAHLTDGQGKLVVTPVTGE